MSVNEKMTAIADAIRAKAKSITGKLTLDDMATNGIDEVYNSGIERGKKAEHNAFWNGYLDTNIVSTSVAHMHKFSGASWNDNTFYPTKDIVVGYGEKWFYYCRITNLRQRLIDCGAKFDFSNATNLGAFFEQSTITEVPVIDLKALSINKKPTTGQRLFYGCKQLVTIEKIKTAEDVTYGNSFTNCVALENVYFEGFIGKSIDFQYSENLSAYSIVNIIEHLSPNVTGQTATFSIQAFTKAESKFPIYYNLIDRYENLDEVIATKPNWNISVI